MKTWMSLGVARDLAGLARMARRRAIAAVGMAQMLEVEGDHAQAVIWWGRALRHCQVWEAALGSTEARDGGTKRPRSDAE